MNYGGSLRSFVIQRGLDLESFVQSIQRYDPKFWEQYTRNHSSLKQKSCPQCTRLFIPMTAKQSTCSRRCSILRRIDKKYFGGKRTFAIGITEGICQLCDKEKKSLSAHHIFGKENDSENDFLIALCSGCHQLVGRIGVRSDVKSVEFWENLISLSFARKDGHRRPLGFHVCVGIEELEAEDII